MIHTVRDVCITLLSNVEVHKPTITVSLSASSVSAVIDMSLVEYFNGTKYGTNQTMSNGPCGASVYYDV